MNDTFRLRRVNTQYRHVSTAWKLYSHDQSPIALVCALLSFIRSSWNYAPIRNRNRRCNWSNPNVFKIPNDDDDY